MHRGQEIQRHQRLGAAAEVRLCSRPPGYAARLALDIGLEVVSAPVLRGTFHVDGVLAFEGLHPGISNRHGLVIYRKKAVPDDGASIVPDGPHFAFSFFRPYLLTTSHSVDELRSGPLYKFQGPNLGAIFKSGGYLYGDSLIRRVNTVDLSLTYSAQAVLVRIEGTAGPVIPGNGLSSKPNISFEVCFDLPISEVLRVAPDCGDEGVKALAQNLTRAFSGGE